METIQKLVTISCKLSNRRMKPVLIAITMIFSEIIVAHDGKIFAHAASASSSATALNHNRFYSDTTHRKKYDPYDDDLLDFGKGSSNSDIKNEEFERTGVASGKPIGTSVKERFDYRDDTGCPPDFRGMCTCNYGYLEKEKLAGKKYIVNCTSAGFSTTEQLQNLPPLTEVLIFTGNNIPNLRDNLFGTKNTFPNLVYIDLSSNGIRNILGKTFHRVNATETLILNNNRISRYTLIKHQRLFSNFVNLKYLLLSSAFEENPDLISDLSEVFIESNLTQLQKLHLENNKIDFIKDPAVFCELPALMDLHLSQNRLSDLNLDVTCLDHMRYIDLTYNNVRSIGQHSKLWNLIHERNHEGTQIRINLWENPFVCDCELNEFLALLQNWTRINPDFMPFEESLTCKDGLPKNNTNRYLKDVLIKDTQCPVLQASDDVGSTALSAIAWVLGLLFLVGLGYFLYNNKHILCRPHSGPLHQATTQGVKYTTIQEEEIAEVAHV